MGYLKDIVRIILSTTVLFLLPRFFLPTGRCKLFLIIAQETK